MCLYQNIIETTYLCVLPNFGRENPKETRIPMPNAINVPMEIGPGTKSIFSIITVNNTATIIFPRVVFSFLHLLAIR